MSDTATLAHELADASERFVRLRGLLKAEQDREVSCCLYRDTDIAETRYEEAKAKWAMR